MKKYIKLLAMWQFRRAFGIAMLSLMHVKLSFETLNGKDIRFLFALNHGQIFFAYLQKTSELNECMQYAIVLHNVHAN